MIASDLDMLLDTFSSTYRHAHVDNQLIDISDCFTNTKGQPNPPRSFGDLSKNSVIAYMVRNGPKPAKYEKTAAGKIKRVHGKPVVQLTDETKILTMLCLAPIKNVSYDEIADALTATTHIQGFTRKHLLAITNKLSTKTGFNPQTDAAYFFADTHEQAYHKAQLNQYWFDQILVQGSTMLDTMTATEAYHMIMTLPKKVLQGEEQALKEHSYMWNRPLHTKESEAFLKQKISAYRSFIQQRWNQHT